MRKFDKVAKDKKSGLPKKYVSGSKNPDKTRNEIKRTRRLYLIGKLSPAMMDRISKQRSKTCLLNLRVLKGQVGFQSLP